MLGSTARRSMDSVAARHLNLSVFVDGSEVLRQIAEQQPQDRAENAHIQFSCATPPCGGLFKLRHQKTEITTWGITMKVS